MRRIILLASVCLLAACSSTRQQGYFHPTFEKSGVTVVPVAVNAPAQIPSESQTLVASKSNEVVSSSESTPSATDTRIGSTHLPSNEQGRKKGAQETVESRNQKLCKGPEIKSCPG